MPLDPFIDLLQRIGGDVPSLASKLRELVKLMDTIGVTDEIVPINLGVPEGVASEGDWNTAFDLNLTQDANFTFVDGAQVWHGANWIGEFIASGANSLSVVNGTGLVIDCNATNTGWFYTVDSAPKIYIPIRDLIPSFEWGVTQLKISAQFDVAGTTSFDLGGIGIDKPFVVNQAWTHRMRAGYSPAYARQSQILMEAAEGLITNPSGNLVNRLHMKSLTHVVYSSRSTSSADADPNDDVFVDNDFTVAGEWSVGTAANITSVAVATPRLAAPGDARLVIAAQSGNTNNNCVLTLKRLRVEHLG